MRFSSLHEWLQWQEGLHPSEIDLGLDRVNHAWQDMGNDSFECPVISVAGTNGKGSSIAMLQAIYLAAGYRVASYTSPHLWHYNERICIDGLAVSDELIIEAFELIDKTRGETSLTYFEFGTLAALHIFSNAKPDIVLLEVGLGGRLDAVNIIDADVALITSIDLDHQAWLGDTREKIAYEKAGILRANKPCVLADPDIPTVIDVIAKELNSTAYRLNQDYGYELSNGQWSWQGSDKTRSGLPIPAISGLHQIQNAAAVLMVLECLNDRVPVNQQSIREGLLSAHIAGRFDIRQDRVPVIFDVAHNAAAAKHLSKTLCQFAGNRRVHAVFSILADKDIDSVISPMLPMVSHWYIAPLQTARSASEAQISELLNKYSASHREFNTVEQALQMAKSAVEDNEIILVFGSFYTVSEAVAETGVEAV